MFALGVATAFFEPVYFLYSFSGLAITVAVLYCLWTKRIHASSRQLRVSLSWLIIGVALFVIGFFCSIAVHVWFGRKFSEWLTDFAWDIGASVLSSILAIILGIGLLMNGSWPRRIIRTLFLLGLPWFVILIYFSGMTDSPRGAVHALLESGLPAIIFSVGIRTLASPWKGRKEY